MSLVRIPTARIHFPLSASVELVIMPHLPGFTSASCPYIDLYPFDVYTTYTEGYEERNVEHNDERLTLYPYHPEFKTGPATCVRTSDITEERWTVMREVS